MGPLHGLRVVELAGLGPAPFCAMLLADLGAEVIRIDRPQSDSPRPALDQLTSRNKQSVILDLKHPEGVAVFLDLAAAADVVIEGMRPGVAERLGIGPDICLERNRRLVYGRMTGWGQTGPKRDRAGHDIDYIALVGALDAIGTPDGGPIPPLNLVGDFGGGALYLVMGILSALLERERSGEGDVIDAAMTDGVASLLTMFYELKAIGMWSRDRGANLLDGGAPFYSVYRAADGGYLAVGALEPQFYAALVDGLGLEATELPGQYDEARWSELRNRIAAEFATKTRDEWAELFAGTDACVVPVLSMDEATEHPHNAARGTFVDVGGVTQPGPAPRFSRSGTEPARPAPRVGEHTDVILRRLGYDEPRIDLLRSAGAFG